MRAVSWCSCNLGLSLGGGASCRSTSISIFQFQTKLINSFVAFVLLNPLQKSTCGSKKASLMICSSLRPLLPVSLSAVWFIVITQQQSLCVPLPIKGDISESVLQHVKNLRWQIAGLRAHTYRKCGVWCVPCSQNLHGTLWQKGRGKNYLWPLIIYFWWAAENKWMDKLSSTWNTKIAASL